MYPQLPANLEVLLMGKDHLGMSAPIEPFSLATIDYSDTLKFHMWAVPYWPLWEWVCSDLYRYTKNLSFPFTANPISLIFFLLSCPQAEQNQHKTTSEFSKKVENVWFPFKIKFYLT